MVFGMIEEVEVVVTMSWITMKLSLRNGSVYCPQIMVKKYVIILGMMSVFRLAFKEIVPLMF